MPLHRDAANPTALRRMGRSLSTTHLAFIIFSLSFLIYAISPQGRPAFHDLLQGAEITRVALSVAQRGTFADPFHALPTGLTAHVAPAYVLLYALVAKLFGVSKAGAIALWSLNIGFLAVQLALLPVLSERLGIGVLPGVLAGVFGVVVQPYRVLPEWESLFTGALLVVVCVLTMAYFKSSRDWRHSALVGFLWGIVILANPQSVLLMFAWPHVAAIENSPEPLARARRAMLVVVAGAALACLPWFIRNYERFHAVFFVRDNFGLELSTSNNPCARTTIVENIESGCHFKMHPNSNPNVAGEVIDQGEIEFNQGQLHQALAWISSNPRAFASLTARRFLKFWFPYLGSLRYAIPTGILTILSFAGLALMFRNHRRAAWMLASTLLLYPFIHYFVQFEARYRYPIFWATFLLAAYAILEFLAWWRKAPQPRVSAAKEQNEIVPSMK
jgi:cbb3-type cytochrome oxidase subunit 3